MQPTPNRRNRGIEVTGRLNGLLTARQVRGGSVKHNGAVIVANERDTGDDSANVPRARTNTLPRSESGRWTRRIDGLRKESNTFRIKVKDNECC